MLRRNVMDLHCETSEKLSKIQAYQKADYDAERWQRWDEEMVDEFGRWLGRLGKTLAILLVAVSATVIVGKMVEAREGSESTTILILGSALIGLACIGKKLKK